MVGPFWFKLYKAEHSTKNPDDSTEFSSGDENEIQTTISVLRSHRACVSFGHGKNSGCRRKKRYSYMLINTEKGNDSCELIHLRVLLWFGNSSNKILKPYHGQ